MTGTAEILNYMIQIETEMSFMSGVSIKQETSLWTNLKTQSSLQTFTTITIQSINANWVLKENIIF